MTQAWLPAHREMAGIGLRFLPRLDAELAITVALREFGVARNDLISPRRDARFIRARAFVVWSLRTLGEPHSYPELARLLGKDCHSVAINLHQRAILLRLRDARFDEACRTLAQRVVALAKRKDTHETRH